MNIGEQIDETEIKKTIYEMLKDETLRYRNNNTFKARRNDAKENDVRTQGKPATGKTKKAK